MFYCQLKLWMNQARKAVINCTVTVPSEERSSISFCCFFIKLLFALGNVENFLKGEVWITKPIKQKQQFFCQQLCQVSLTSDKVVSFGGHFKALYDFFSLYRVNA